MNKGEIRNIPDINEYCLCKLEQSAFSNKVRPFTDILVKRDVDIKQNVVFMQIIYNFHMTEGFLAQSSSDTW